MYSQLLFNTQRSPLLKGEEELHQYVKKVEDEAAPDAVLKEILDLNTPARRDALRHARIPVGDISFVAFGLKWVISELYELTRRLKV